MSNPRERLEWYSKQREQIIEEKRDRPPEPLNPEELEDIDGPFEVAGHRSTLESDALQMEVRPVFVNGYFFSTTILCAAIVEQILSGELEEIGIRSQDEQLTFGCILNRIEDSGVLTNSEFDMVNELKEARNSLLHFRGWGDERSPLYNEIQEVGKEYDPQVVGERLARKSIRTMLQIEHIQWPQRRAKFESIE